MRRGRDVGIDADGVVVGAQPGELVEVALRERDRGRVGVSGRRDSSDVCQA
jgi:hypothetical protein